MFIASRVCRGLQYVFEKARIVHRDVSPSNVMMTTEGTVKLIDFGIAARSGTRESYLAGKPSYMAPEMVVEMRADQRSDLFSLGAVLFEMLTGERLFQGETTAEILEHVVTADIPGARSLNPAVPEAVEGILARALERQPGRSGSPRPRAMGEACEHYLYDKGYGPTNLTLKHYLLSLFGRELRERAGRGRAGRSSRRSSRCATRCARSAVEDGEPTTVVVPPLEEGRRARGDAAAGHAAQVAGRGARTDAEAPAAVRRPDAAASHGLGREEPQALDDRRQPPTRARAAGRRPATITWSPRSGFSGSRTRAAR